VLPLLEVFQTSNRFFSLVDGVEFSPRSTGTFFSIELHFRLVVCKDGNENTISFAAVYVFYSNAETGDRDYPTLLVMIKNITSSTNGS